MEEIFDDIHMERHRQDKIWGGAVHDDRKDMRDWASYIVVYLGRACGRETDWGQNTAKVRGLLVKVAALAVAALQAIDRRGIPGE